MNLFRCPFLKNSVALITAIIFLNMSFFLAEITAMKLDRHSAMVENIIKLMSGNGFEEESEAVAESTESNFQIKEVDLLVAQNLLHHKSEYITAQQRNGVLHLFFVDEIYTTIFSPPPEGSFNV